MVKMKKIIISLSVIAVVATVIIGATGAYFNTSVTSTGNTFQTASLNIDITNTAFEKRVLDGRGMYPGAFVQSAVTINNTGTAGFNPDLVLTNGNGNPDKLWFEVWTNGKLWYSNWLNQFPGYNQSTRVTLDKVNPGQSVNVAFRLILDESADNSLMGANYSVDMNVVGRQWNDPSYASTTATADTGYVVNTWSYNVCGVRQPGFGYALKAGESYDGRGYNNTLYSPFYSYVVKPTMVNTDDLWALQTKPAYTFTGFDLANDGVCTLRDGPSNAVGANLSAYVKPTCDHTVSAQESIQTAIDSSEGNETICVSGTHAENVNVDHPGITLAGDGSGSTILNNSGVAGSGTLNITASNVTVEGFTINNDNGSAAVYISSPQSGITLAYNSISKTGPGASGANNVLLTSGGQSNHTITNNVFGGSLAGPGQLVYVLGKASVNVASTNVNFTHNTFNGSASFGLGEEAAASTIAYNKFNITGASLQVETWEANSVVNYNNFDATASMISNSHNLQSVNVGTLDATNNWWGDLTPATHVTGGTVNYTPFAATAYPEY